MRATMGRVAAVALVAALIGCGDSDGGVAISPLDRVVVPDPDDLPACSEVLVPYDGQPMTPDEYMNVAAYGCVDEDGDIAGWGAFMPECEDGTEVGYNDAGWLDRHGIVHAGPPPQGVSWPPGSPCDLP